MTSSPVLNPVSACSYFVARLFPLMRLPLIRKVPALPMFGTSAHSCFIINRSLAALAVVIIIFINYNI